MSNQFADLHSHSFYSDGTNSPEEILNRAKEKNVGLLALTDHNRLEGTAELLNLCKNSDIKCLSGVELDAVDEDINFHILAYGIDLSNQHFVNFVNKNRGLLDELNRGLIEKMEKDFSEISLVEYDEFEHDRRKGGWKILDYFMEKGLTTSLLEGNRYYRIYEQPHTCVAFPTTKQVCEQIHQAGGKAILAHPGKVIHQPSIEAFIKEVEKTISWGVDGIECYYPAHSKEVTEATLKFCKDRNLLITCGCDYHGSFQKTEIGELQIPIEYLVLGDLYPCGR